MQDAGAALPRTLSGLMPPVAGGGLQRRASAPPMMPSARGLGDERGPESRGLPVNYTLRHSGAAKGASRRERVLCLITLLALLALSGSAWLVWRLVVHNRATHKHATSHYEGWKVRLSRCGIAVLCVRSF